ncbi:unnamed protein product [Protopolystoma xenopodis]|uniref:rRNA adenine N(6)-methyltransferase n=1 Tax=Protopolystoma xenopodis TaxID=117903 RepID=A0A3S5B3N1_9PLAT|nr:unnamed protein product [Protopolystoma xenopodis]
MHSKLEILVGDAIKAEEWPKFDLCVANLPYQISSPFILRLIKAGRGYRCAVVMVQKEFAARLLAQPGDKLYCRLSANVQFHCKVAHLLKVSRNSFRPPPRVDSAVVRLEPRHPKPPVSIREWDGLLRLAFLRKNKKLSANFQGQAVAKLLYHNCQTVLKANSSFLTTPLVSCTATDDVFAMESRIAEILRASGFDGKRARTMDEDDFLRLLLAFKREGIYFG